MMIEAVIRSQAVYDTLDTPRKTLRGNLRRSAANVQEEPGGTVCRGLALCTVKVSTVV